MDGNDDYFEIAFEVQTGRDTMAVGAKMGPEFDSDGSNILMYILVMYILI